nr:MAG TPA: DNA-binding domain protein [Caudoviricetes sp.]
MKYLKVYTDFEEAIEMLGDAEKGRLFTAMLRYASTGELPDLRGGERLLWPTAKLNIDRTRAEAEKNTINGKKGGRPKTQNNPEKPNETLKDKDKENKIIPLSPNGDIPPKGERTPAKRFVKPTAEDVRAYCAERGNCVDAQAFVDFYEAKGWKVGSSPMKDWKAAVRTWEKRDAERKQAAMSRPNRQRDLCSSRTYSAAELDRMGYDLLGGD